ncbi:MAG: hypothetical protein ACP5MB_10285 [bacterium]
MKKVSLAPKVAVSLTAYDENGNITGRYYNPLDLSTKQMAQWVQASIFNTAETITNTAGTGIAVTADTSPGTTILICAGTGTTAAAVTDYALGTPIASGEYTAATASGSVAATIGAYSGSGTSGSFTVTGTITNSSTATIAYSEVGIVVGNGTNAYLLTHDVFSALNVSANGTLAVTYTLTYE